MNSNTSSITSKDEKGELVESLRQTEEKLF